MQTPLLHQTDLFRPHNDPDDHWDLACAFAIAKLGLTPLSAILIDHPPGPPILNHPSDPDLGSVAQLAYLTGICPPVAVGSPKFFSLRDDLASTKPPVGVEFVLKLLRESTAPVAISIVGSARDIAEAIAREPALFAQKCACIYLVAGSGHPDPTKHNSREWNVKLDPAAFAQLFAARCPIYWLPCLEDEPTFPTVEAKTYAGHFQFLQSEILDTLPAPVRSYFGFMFEKRESSWWLTALNESFDDVLATQRAKPRMMYSTPLFFDAAGQCVTTSGEIRPKEEKRDDWVYRFDPIDVSCDANGVTRWTPAAGGSNRHIFHVLDLAAYPTAMTRAMKQLLNDAFQGTAR